MKKYLLIISLFILSSCSINQPEQKAADFSPAFKALDRTKNIVEQNNERVEEQNKVLENKNQEIRGVKIAQQAKYYQVTKVVDGDTIDVDIDGQIKRVRLIGINTPEVVDPRRPVQCFGKEASAEAKQLLGNQEVSLESDQSQDDMDKYGRLLRYVKTKSGLFYNLEILKLGFAHEFTYHNAYKYQKEFKEAENYAKQNKLGLWADGACSIKNSDIASKPASGSCLIKGNINSKKQKIYHLPNCQDYQKTFINESQGEKWFCSEAEATKAGWRKAGNCK